MHNRLKPVDLSRYLNFDLITIIEISCLLTGHAPVDINEFLQNDFKYPEQHKIYEMAKASVTAKKIEGQGSHLCFAATPMTWISWADSKELKLPKVFRKAYEEYKEKEKEPTLRPNESYRPIDESQDRAIAQHLMQVIHDFMPELPIRQLVRTLPIKQMFKDNYSPETLTKWAKDFGLETKKGTISKEIREKCENTIPKRWDFEWYKEK